MEELEAYSLSQTESVDITNSKFCWNSWRPHRGYAEAWQLTR